METNTTHPKCEHLIGRDARACRNTAVASVAYLGRVELLCATHIKTVAAQEGRFAAEALRMGFDGIAQASARCAGHVARIYLNLR